MKRVEVRNAVELALLTFLVLNLSGCTQHTVVTTKAPPAPTAEPTAIVQPEQHSFKVWFVKEKDGQLEYIGVDRKTGSEATLYEAVKELMNGPSEQEQSEGLRSEVPGGTTLIDVKEIPEGFELNLSSKFASDGGSESIEARIEQLRRTVEEAARDRKVYLDVDGKRLTEAGGEGLEVKQPIN
jgi:spore germination protein GerM